jgi:hypothetical protein
MGSSRDAGFQADRVKRSPSPAPIVVAEGLWQFEVVVVRADQQPHRLASGFDGSDEFAGLAPEFGGLAGSICGDQRRLQSVRCRIGLSAVTVASSNLT